MDDIYRSIELCRLHHACIHAASAVIDVPALHAPCMHVCLQILLVQQAPQRRNWSPGKRYCRLQERLARCVCSGLRGRPQRLR